MVDMYRLVSRRRPIRADKSRGSYGRHLLVNDGGEVVAAGSGAVEEGEHAVAVGNGEAPVAHSDLIIAGHKRGPERLAGYHLGGNVKASFPEHTLQSNAGIVIGGAFRHDHLDRDTGGTGFRFVLLQVLLGLL